MDNKKICWSNIFVSLIIWLFSNSTILVLVLLGAGDQRLSPGKRVIFAVTSFISDMSDGKYFAETRKKLSTESRKNQNRNLRLELDKQKQKLDNFVANIFSLPRLAVFIKMEEDIQKAFVQYAKANKILSESGENTDNEFVINAVERLTSLNSRIDNEFTRQYAARGDMSVGQRKEILSKCLLNTAQGYEIVIDSVGIGNDMYGNKSRLIVNGYWQFDPKKIQIKPDIFMTELGFTKQRDPKKHNMFICFVKSENKKDFEIYYGEKSRFDLDNFDAWHIFDNDRAMNFEISFSDIWRGNIPCSRLSKWRSPEFDVLVVDMRPQKWCSFAFSEQLYPSTLLSIEKQKNFTVSPIKYSSSFSSGKITRSHLIPNSYLFKDLAQDIAAVAVPHPQQIELNKLFEANASNNTQEASDIPKKPSVSAEKPSNSAKPSVSVPKPLNSPKKPSVSAEELLNSPKKTSVSAEKLLNSPKKPSVSAEKPSANPPRDKDSGTYYNNKGIALENKGKYNEAFQSYTKAAELGNEYGRLNRALLLVNRRCKIVNRQGRNVSYIEARRLLLQITAESNNREVLGYAYNALGYIHMLGTRGLKPDFAKAEKYLQIAIQYGNPLAKNNLQLLKRVRR